MPRVIFIQGDSYAAGNYDYLPEDRSLGNIYTPVIVLNDAEWENLNIYHSGDEGGDGTYHSLTVTMGTKTSTGGYSKNESDSASVYINQRLIRKYVLPYITIPNIFTPTAGYLGFVGASNPYTIEGFSTTPLDLRINSGTTSSMRYGSVFIKNPIDGSTSTWPCAIYSSYTGTSSTHGVIGRSVVTCTPESDFPSLAKAIFYEVGFTKSYSGSVEFQISWSRVSGTMFDWYRNRLEPLLSTDVTPPSGLIPDSNEQDPGGTSEPGGGNGDFDDTSDPIPLPDLPTISATDCGLVTAYRASRQNLLDLGEYLYSPLLDLDTLKKLFDQPMQWLIGLNILPFSPTISGSKEIKFAAFGTGVTSDYCAQQYHEIDCGSVEVQEHWGSALDYSPNTRAYLWLPFIGFVQVDVDIIMGSTCNVIYRVDILTGACIAVLMVNGSAVNHWTGQCASNIPMSASDYSRVIGSLLSVAGTAIGSAAAIGGALGELTNAGAAVAAAQDMVKTAPAASLGSATTQLKVAQEAQATARSNAANSIISGVSNTVSNVMGAKLGVQMSGSISGNAGLLDVQKPYFMFIRPRQSLAENYKHYVGYPSNMFASVESCKGFTRFEQIELAGIEATDGEIAEIAQILKGGFYG